MKKFIPYIIIISIVFAFFYKTILFGKIPFPGDLLLTSYAPWRHVSYSGYVAGAIPSKDQYFDVVRELYPWKTEVIRQLKESTIPLWNPYSFSGSPLLANYQSQVFYPFGILYFLMPQIYAWTLLIMLQPILGSIFMYLFATTIGISSLGALIAAIAFNFSSFATVWVEFNTIWHTILWLPLLLYLIEKAIERHRFTFWSASLFIFALFSSITGGHPQDFINSFLFFSLYTIIRILTKKDWNKKEKISFIFYPLAFILIIPFLLAAPQLLPTIDLFKNSARVTHDYKQIITMMLVQPWQLGIIVIQDFFGNPAVKTDFLNNTYVGKALSIGSAGFFLSLVSFFSKKHSWHKVFFSIASIILLVITINSPITKLLYLHPIPILSTGSPTRILFLFCFSAAILAGFGYDMIRETKKILWKPIIIMCLIMIILWVFALIHPHINGLIYTETAYQTMKKAMLLGSIIIGASIILMIAGKIKHVILNGFLVLITFELLYSFLRFNPFVPKGFVFPDNPLITYFQKQKGIDRIWGYGTTQIEANFSTQYRLFSSDGTDPLNLSWYNEFIQTSKNGTLPRAFNRTTRSDAQIAPGYGEKDLPENIYRLKVMDALGVKYVIDRTENPKDFMTFSPDRFKEIFHKEDWTVYENLKSAPRFFLTTNIHFYKTIEDFEQQFSSPSFIPSEMILFSIKDKEHIPSVTKSLGAVTLISYKPSEVLFNVTTENTTILYLSDTFDIGWNVFIDGKKEKILKANYAFRAVVVPKGTHTVTFSYQPKSFSHGLQLSALGGIILIAFLLITTKEKNIFRKKQ